MYDRCYDPDGVRRQTEALQNSPDRTPFLSRISASTTIIHGSDDNLINAAASTAIYHLIDNSTLTIYPGMGHELPHRSGRRSWPRSVPTPTAGRNGLRDDTRRRARPRQIHNSLMSLRMTRPPPLVGGRCC